MFFMNYSIVVPIFNEENRIGALLCSLSSFDNEIVILNKSSTDMTKAVIERLNMPNVSVYDIPYTEKGDDDFEFYASYSKNDWVFIMVASEVVPKGYFTILKNKLDELSESEVDLLMVPRKYYCFGFHVPRSPWEVSYFPFFFNKNNVNFVDVPHLHVAPKNEKRRKYLNFQIDEMIVHNTHPNLRNFMNSAINYGDLETEKENNDKLKMSIYNSLRNIWLSEKKMSANSGLPSLMHFAAWNIHWNYQIIKRCERLLTLRNENNERLYENEFFLKKKFSDHLYFIYMKYFYGKLIGRSLHSRLKILKKFLGGNS